MAVVVAAVAAAATSSLGGGGELVGVGAASSLGSGWVGLGREGVELAGLSSLYVAFRGCMQDWESW